jgi:miniconductance mechanosensitive channel
MITPIVTISLIPFVLINESDLRALIIKLCWIYIIILGIKLACSFISSLYAISSEHEKYKNHSLKGFFQMIKLIVICIGTIIIISTLINKNPLTILASLGAGTAILMLVFQDTIKGLVAGIQLMANDMLRPGDWITMPKYGADGDVLEVTLTTVKVRNWDQTITTVPTYSLINDSFQNWRGMFEAGGRRVKRSLNIDMNTIRFCTKQEMENYNQQPWMKGFKETGNEEVNLHIFRHYVDYYLRNHPVVSKDMTLLVRQLQPTPEGLPIELYFFSADTRWANYEQLQAEVFDHIIAKLHTFDLKVFQSPSGLDIKRN